MQKPTIKPEYPQSRQKGKEKCEEDYTCTNRVAGCQLNVKCGCQKRSADRKVMKIAEDNTWLFKIGKICWSQPNVIIFFFEYFVNRKMLRRNQDSTDDMMVLIYCSLWTTLENAKCGFDKIEVYFFGREVFPKGFRLIDQCTLLRMLKSTLEWNMLEATNRIDKSTDSSLPFSVLRRHMIQWQSAIIGFEHFTISWFQLVQLKQYRIFRWNIIRKCYRQLILPKHPFQWVNCHSPFLHRLIE